MADLLGKEFEAGIATKYHSEDGKLIIERATDVEPLLEANKRLRNDEGDWRRASKGGDFKLAARLDPVIVEKWKTEFGIDFFNRDHWPKIKQLLNGEFCYFKTTAAKI